MCFTVKSRSFTQRLVSQEMLLKTAKIRRLLFFFFFFKIIGSNNYFTLIVHNQIFKIAKFEFKVTAQYGLWDLKNKQTNKQKQLSTSGVARTFPGGRLAHPEGQNEEENK